ncbi:T9SS type A sorting domain-containing protein [Flavilitoribacter nigricans]|uniref:Dockerin domain-containing protein n=1 Tax=Flavilitoribacter nigricans (strain ATCC 23147 / DSM 23189 / NBRC 102662 / NCIMB 1420 / SS-2) TaxID=1122177 RepID=A0A2D0MXV3_FLAN2|nr:T9SS type A sorting domain-containing protein [Flavilitoribacter nigricans]PHN01111.1 hypothetical protein CRP01_38900 [Flavilitoribacter nigricans DSM 23189 = NBRC 102662]
MKGTSCLIPASLRFVLFCLIGAGLILPNEAFASENNFPSEFDLTCSNQVNVNLQGDCQALLVAENLLLGDKTGLDMSLYSIVVDDADKSNGGTVDGCGTFIYEISGPDNFGCWGYVTAEDKEPVAIECLEDINGYETEAGFVEFLCSDLDTLLIKGVAEYTTDADGNVVEISDELKKILDITGYPTIIENCGDVVVTVKDEVVVPDDNCLRTSIKRTFTATNSACLESSASCVTNIYFNLPDLDDVDLPKETVELECSDEFELDDKGNPHPDETGYPTVTSAFGTYDLNDTYCNLGASYKDGERVEVCEGTYKIVRSWQILDWCNGLERILEASQVIKVVDSKGPVVMCEPVDYDHDGISDLRTYSTGPYDCTASFEVPMPIVEDECSSWTVLTEILAGGYEGPVVATILPDKSRYVSGIPLGCHVIRYTVVDDCGNKTVKLCPFQIEDQVAPIAVCDDDLHIGIGGLGYARVDATDIDEGSSDNCGPIRVEVRRRILDITTYDCLDIFDTDGNGVVINDEVRLSAEFGDPDGDGVPGEFFYYTPWEEYVEFSCCDMNENVRIELRVWDDRNGNGYPGDTDEVDLCFNYEETSLVTDNYNVCWLDVLIEDKVEPVCVPPLPAEIDCNALPFDFDPTDADQMTELFGAAEGSDNCPDWTVTELDPVTDNINDCGAGSFVRRFEVTDAKGIKSATCEQVITIHQIHDYWIKFPADAQAECGTPTPDTVMVKEDACDLLAISVKDEFFSASGDECYKIFRTYSVINWCEYDGESGPVVVNRDEDCDGYPGDEDVYVIVKTRKDTDPCADYYGGEPAESYQHVWYDRDSDPFNLLPMAGTKGEDCDYETNPFGFWKEVIPITENEPKDKDTDNYPEGYYGDHCETMASVGYWQYTQVIKVYDTVNPIVSWDEMDPFCSYSSDFDNGCPAEVTINFSVDENCTPDDLTIKLFLDADADGVIDEEITDLLSGTYPNYSVTGTFPLGTHSLGVSVDDGCGNQVGINIPFEVADCKAPVPTCLNGLAIELMPVIPAEDVNGDGVIDDGAMTIWASDFVASPAYDCSGEVTYSINRSIGETPDPSKTALTLTCSDPPNTLIQIWAYDAAGNSDLCETYLLVQDNMVQCNGLTGGGAVAGVVALESSVAVQDVEVSVSGQELMGAMTDVEGRYTIEGLEEGFDYSLIAHKNENPLNGVSTFDLVLMSKHILGTQLLDSPYKMIAADVNNSGTITSMDAISLRRLVLNIDTKFSNNSSWRFIPRRFDFPNASNPWSAPFPEVLNINNLQGTVTDRSFVAIKIGDLNSSAIGNVAQGNPRNIQGAFALDLDEQQLQAGGTYRVDFRAKDLADIQGFQGTINLEQGAVELIDIEAGVLTMDNFGLRLIDEGFITTSWHRIGDLQTSGEEILFTLILRSRTEAPLSEVIRLSSRQTVAEAYNNNDELLDLNLSFGAEAQAAGIELYQNRPNPFFEDSQIGFYLPEAASVSLTIHDASGRMIKLIRGDFARGNHQFNIRRSDLASSGVLYYTLTSGTFTATKKMIIIE